MAKQKTYYWRGPGELLGCKAGEKVPVSKMDKKQLAKMIGDGRLQETAFGIEEDTNVVAELQANVNTLSEKIVELNKKVKGGDDYDCEACKEAADKIAELEETVKKLTADLEAATEPKD